MKTQLPFAPACRNLTVLLLTVFGGSAIVSAQSPVEEARSGEARQQQIHADSKKLIEQLDAMIDEYARNGIEGDDAQNLKNLRAVLDRMSEKEMQQVLALLRKAAENGDAANALKSIAQAYTAQKGLLVQMKHILSTHARSQELLELTHKIDQIAERQAMNLQTGVETAHWALDGNRPAAEVEASMEGQLAEQKAIAEELKLLKEEIEKLGKTPGNKETADRFAKALQELKNVTPALDAAAKALEEKQLFNAVKAEKEARDQMRQLARTLTPPQDEAEALRTASSQIAKLIEQQESVLDATVKATTKPKEQWLSEVLADAKSGLHKELKKKDLLKLKPAELMEHEVVKKGYSWHVNNARQFAAGLETRQGDIVTQSEALGQNLTQLAKNVTDALNSAIPEMQEARAAMSETDLPGAASSEKKALAILKNAQTAIEQKLAAAESAAETAGDPVAALKKAQESTQELMRKQAELAKTTPGPKTPEQNAAAAQQQKALEAKAADLRAKTAEQAPAASQALAQASTQMQQASNAMNNGAQPQAAAAQAQAMQSLAAASQQLAQQLAQAQQAQQAAAAAQQALSGLAPIIEAQQKLQIETAIAAAKEKTSPEPVKQLAPRQQSIQADTSTFQQSLVNAPAIPGTVPSTQNIVSAISHMNAAHGHLKNALGTAADPEEQKALEDLYLVQDKLEAQLAAAQQQMGADAAEAEAQQAPSGLEQAQQQVAEAMSTLQQAGQQAPPEGSEPGQQPPPAGAQPGQQPPPASQQAAQTQKAAAQLEAAAKTAGEMANTPGLPQAAQESLRDASESLGEAAAEATAADNEGAQEAAKEGADALASAQAALGQAMAGISTTPPPPGSPAGPPQPGQPPGPPGESDGNTDGSQDPGSNTGPGEGKLADGSQFLGLPAQDRMTLQQSQSEKYPQEYAAQVEQYLQNLADESSSR